MVLIGGLQSASLQTHCGLCEKLFLNCKVCCCVESLRAEADWPNYEAWTQYLCVSRTSSLWPLRSCRYFSVISLKFSDTDPKLTSGLKVLIQGSGQRDTFLRYFDLPDSSRASHCSTTCGVHTTLCSEQGWKLRTEWIWGLVLKPSRLK